MQVNNLRAYAAISMAIMMRWARPLHPDSNLLPSATEPDAAPDYFFSHNCMCASLLRTAVFVALATVMCRNVHRDFFCPCESMWHSALGIFRRSTKLSQVSKRCQCVLQIQRVICICQQLSGAARDRLHRIRHTYSGGHTNIALGHWPELPHWLKCNNRRQLPDGSCDCVQWCAFPICKSVSTQTTDNAHGTQTQCC